MQQEGERRASWLSCIFCLFGTGSRFLLTVNEMYELGSVSKNPTIYNFLKDPSRLNVHFLQDTTDSKTLWLFPEWTRTEHHTPEAFIPVTKGRADRVIEAPAEGKRKREGGAPLEPLTGKPESFHLSLGYLLPGTSITATQRGLSVNRKH